MITAYPYFNMLDIRHEAVAILTAVNAGEGTYDTHTLIQILKGEVPLPNKNASLTGQGMLSGVYRERILNLINYLLEKGFLAYSENGLQTLQVKESGRKFLQYPSDLPVSSRALKLSPYDNMLRNSLIEWRENICETESLPPFRVLTAYAIQRVVQDRPENLKELENIPGLGPYKAKKYGAQILEIIDSINQIQLSVRMPL
jgi:superfamily II DNA helicase RecQ